MYKVDEVLGINQSEWTDWTWQQSQSIKVFRSLREKWPWLEDNVESTSSYFQLQITPYYLSLLDLQNSQDPLAKICIPSVQELNWKPHELVDPIGDRVNNEELQHSPTPAIVHRYADRCLLFLTPLCSSYCRYCFRREMVAKPENVFSKKVLQDSFEYIQNTTSLREVILSGGDPLLWSDNKLAEVLKTLDQISHLQSLRIHTRFPVFNPFRITDDFVSLLASLSKPMTIMLHIMHPRELTPELRKALQKLKKAGLNLFNQSVLIKDCNDDRETLQSLSEGLVNCGVVPKYLHLLDLARGTSHFRVSIAKAQSLLAELRKEISSHLVPQFMLEIPGGYGKISIDGPYFQKIEGSENQYLLQSPIYPEKKIYYKDIL
jgi:lysine 2,3-aminomutase